MPDLAYSCVVYVTLCFVFYAEYKKSERKGIKERKMTQVEVEQEEEEELHMEIWTYHCQDDQVRFKK